MPDLLIYGDKVKTSSAQLNQLLENDPSLRQQLALINSTIECVKSISNLCKRALCLKLPFLAHPAYNLASRPAS